MENLIKRKWEAGVLLLLLLNFIPLLSSWFYGDDMVSRDIRAVAEYTEMGYWGYLKNGFQYNMITVGRFYPLHIIQRFIVFALFSDNIWAYRLFMCAMNAAAVYSFAVMVKAFSGSRRYMCAVLFLFSAMFFQLTPIDDAITGYYGFIQCLVIYMSVSLILLKKYAEKGKRIHLAISVFLYVLSLLTYETSYPLLLCYPTAMYFTFGAEKYGLSFTGRIKKSVRVTTPHFIAMLLCAIGYVWFKLHSTAEYTGISASLEPAAIGVTLAKQIMSAMPMAPQCYRLLEPSALINISNLYIVITALFAGLLFWTLPADDNNTGMSENNRNAVLILAAEIVLLSSAPVAVSGKYQNALAWSMGYLPYYMARFGVIVLLFSLYELLLHMFGKRSYIWKALCLILVIVLQMMTLTGNSEIINKKNESTIQRFAVEQAISDGLFVSTRDNSTILFKKQWWSELSGEHRSSVVSYLTGNHIYALLLRQFVEQYGENGITALDFNGRDYYYFDYETHTGDDGFACLAKLTTVTGPYDDLELIAGELTLFCYDDNYSFVEIPVDDKIVSFPLEQKEGYRALTLKKDNMDVGKISLT